jgi:hypothetical protein
MIRQYRCGMRLILLAGLLGFGMTAPVLAAEFGSVQLPDWGASNRLFDQEQIEQDRLRTQMMELELERRREELVRRQERREELAHRQQQREQPVYYCKLPDGRFVVCR